MTPRDSRDPRDPRDPHKARSRDPRDLRDPSRARDPRGSRDPGRTRQVERPRVNRSQPRKPISPVERLLRIERRKARSRAVFLSILVLAIMLVMTLMILIVMQKTKPRPQFLFIQNGTLTHEVEGRALILRDDGVLAAPVAGLVKPLANEGTRVARGQKIALVIPAGLEKQLDELKKCEQDITDLQNELMNQGKGAGARAIYNESAVALSAIVNLIRSDVLSGSLSSLPTYTASMSVIMDQRSGKLATVDFHDARLDQLIAQRQTLEQSLGLASGTLYSDRPGVVSFYLDNQESTLTAAAVETLTISQFKDALKATTEQSTAETEVKAATPVLRVTSGLKMFLAVYLENIQPGSLDENKTYQVVASADGTRIDGCKIVRTEGDGKGTLVIFAADRKIEWFSDRRVVDASVAVAETDGMKIPRVALIDFDPQAKTADILIVNGGYTRQVPVDIVDFDREYAIIAAQEETELKPTPSTVIVVNPESIAAGEFIGD